ncbi:hypothetical protein VKT23_006111 [Stygiomarasmius scandens]|uniref:Major facilitator superfamily (MFS) profile domain-containing protein n=1 Tax=Marasmiellus scandens TaxID=2682957 RepID=A0ABR1JPW8_9AGAR
MSLSEPVITTIPRADVEQSQTEKDATGVQTGAGNVDLASFPKFDDMTFAQVGLILFSLGLALFLFAIEETIVATSVASIGAALDIKTSLTWISTSYLLTTTIIQPVTGRIADAVGTKRLLLIELWVFVIGNIIAGTSNTLGQIIVGRLISGLGGAGLLSLACILVSQLTHEKQRASYMNLINVTFIISDSLGPIIGGALAKSGNWRWIFLLNAPFGPVITLILVRYLRIPSTSTQIRSIKDVLTKVDLVGMLMLMACLSFIVVSLNSGGQEMPWHSPTIIGLLVAAGVSWVGFWVAEKHAKMPVAPVKLFVRWEWRNVPLMFVVRTLLFFHNFAMVFYAPIFLQVIGLNEVTSSALIIPFLLVAAVSSSTANMLCSKYGYVRTVFLGGLVFLPVGVGLMSTLSDSSSIGRIIGYSLIAGFGFGSGTQLTMVIAQVGLPADELSTVTALVGSAPTLGGTLGVAVIGTVINNAFRQRLLDSSVLASASSISLNPNDVVNTLRSFAEGDPARQLVVDAYVSAWQKGCWTLVGVAGLEILLFLFARKVEMADGSRDAVKGHEGEKTETVAKGEEREIPQDSAKTEVEFDEGTATAADIREERREIVGDENNIKEVLAEENTGAQEKQVDEPVLSSSSVKRNAGWNTLLDRLLFGLRVKASVERL